MTQTSVPRRAFTLVEMLMVLFILSLLTVVAVQATDVLMDQGRIDATYAAIQEVRQAIAGQPGLRAADGSILITGYVADMGALPTSLDDLITPPANAPVFGLYPFPAGLFPQTTVASGWNGPYLRLPPGRIRPADAWGNDLTLVSGNIVSLGADNAPGGTGVNSDIIEAVGPVVGGLAGQITSLDEMGIPKSPRFDDGEIITVFLLSPSPQESNPVIQVPLQTITLDSSYDGTKPVTYSATGLLIGPRVIQAVQGNGTSVARRSPLTRVMIRPTAQIQHLTLQEP